MSFTFPESPRSKKTTPTQAKDKWRSAKSKLVFSVRNISKEEQSAYQSFDPSFTNSNDQAFSASTVSNKDSNSTLLNKLSKWLKTSYFKQEICVLVSDLSGFTRLTRKYGVIHFASVIVRKRQLCLPILHKHGALFISTEADNFIVIMPFCY